MTRIALYQPDIPQNAGAAMRLCACMGTGLDIIEPCGFLWQDRKIKQSGMDYVDGVDLIRHRSWEKFRAAYDGKRRVVLLTTKAAMPYTDFSFRDSDIIMAGQESSGVPDEIHDIVDARLVIPMREGLRSLNIVNAVSMVLGEALRQTRD
jgi:tRNA (cytidine/uridine-2'-O-)-methyltransferase